MLATTTSTTTSTISTSTTIPSPITIPWVIRMTKTIVTVIVAGISVIIPRAIIMPMASCTITRLAFPAIGSHLSTTTIATSIQSCGGVKTPFILSRSIRSIREANQRLFETNEVRLDLLIGPVALLFLSIGKSFPSCKTSLELRQDSIHHHTLQE